MLTEQKSLDSLLYKNEDVIHRFTKIYDVKQSEAEDIFNETLKWLWITQNVDFPFFIDDSILILDEMWHNFILFTNDYHEYCLKYFGKFIHHQPSTASEQEAWKKNWKAEMKKYEKQLKKQYELVYDYLGEDTLKKWYVTYSENYSKEKIKLLIR